MTPKRYRSDLRRRRPSLSARSRLLIVCEGELTETTYLKDVRHRHRTRLVDVLIVGLGGTPKTIVERAVEKKKAAEQLARRVGDSFLTYDEVWCVFDVDQHPNVADAMQQASANRIQVALSNPCFELWLLLHFQDQRAHIERGQAQSRCRDHMPDYKKEPPMELLRDRYDVALARAAALEKWQEENGRVRGNPSTEVHKLTERIRQVSAAFQL